VADQLQNKGWNVTRQQTPESLHITLSPAHVDFIQEFVSDLKEAVKTVKANPKLNTSGQAAMYGMMGKKAAASSKNCDQDHSSWPEY